MPWIEINPEHKRFGKNIKYKTDKGSYILLIDDEYRMPRFAAKVTTFRAQGEKTFYLNNEQLNALHIEQLEEPFTVTFSNGAQINILQEGSLITRSAPFVSTRINKEGKEITIPAIVEFPESTALQNNYAALRNSQTGRLEYLPQMPQGATYDVAPELIQGRAQEYAAVDYSSFNAALAWLKTAPEAQALRERITDENCAVVFKEFDGRFAAAGRRDV